MQDNLANIKCYSLFIQKIYWMVVFMQKTGDLLAPFHSFAIEHAAVGIHAINNKGNTILYNKKMKQIEGLALEDIQDRSILELFNLNHEESTLLKVVQSGKKLLNIKQTYWNHDGIEITTVNDTYPVFEDDKIIGAVEFARDVTALEKFMHQPFQQSGGPINFNVLIAASAAMKTVISTAKKAVKAKLPVLLIGETGTGKDLIAQSIHNASSPTNRFYYTLHCHSSDSLLIERLIEDLDDNESYTLFCDRIDLLAIPLQQKLLATLSKPVNGHRQFIASIGDDPVALIASGTLLKDLYYFFSSIAIRIPPLRERRSDIMPFISTYLVQRRERHNLELIELSPEVEKLFLDYEWPGNMRELELLLDEITSHAMEETSITYEMLPLHFRLKIDDSSDESMVAEDFIMQRDKALLPLDEYLLAAETYYLENAMKIHDGNVTKTAKALGMSRQNLQYRLRKIK